MLTGTPPIPLFFSSIPNVGGMFSDHDVFSRIAKKVPVAECYGIVAKMFIITVLCYYPCLTLPRVRKAC